VDALYTSNPHKPGARRITDVRSDADLTDVDVATRGSAVGTGGMVTKVDAARIATSAGIPVVLTDTGQVTQALAGAPVGTCFHATGKRRPTRLLWLEHASHARGELVLDAGAVRALVQRNASLLPAGITSVTGTFSAGEPVNLVGPDGAVVARGLANYDSDELPGLLGRTTRELTASFGAGYDRTVVHRDALVIVDGS
jgi:glutamate 5-kinase